jgi:diadenosine tetraphosphate (Ap4A) HIT family hydrolase
MENDCLFCKIISGKIPCTKVYEDEYCFAFNDIAPKAPLHVLFVPREHFSGTLEITPEREKSVGHLALAAAKVAKEKGISEGGYRLVFNTNADAGQTVFHLHMHLLGGRALGGMA